jgi:hypothetical protein
VVERKYARADFAPRRLEKVAVEVALAATAYNLTRRWNTGSVAPKAG